jgi:hypothetical protein
MGFFARPAPFLITILVLTTISCLTDEMYEEDSGTDTGIEDGTDSEACRGVLYQESFDSSSGSFVASGSRSSWDWGIGTEGLGCRAGSCWSTNPWGDYNQCEDSTLTSPPIDLSECMGRSASVSLRYWHWFDFEWNTADSACNDGVAVEFSTDGGYSWNQIAPRDGWTPSLLVPALDCRSMDPLFSPHANGRGGFDCQGNEDTWEQIGFELPATMFVGNLQVRFVMGSTYEGQYAGYTVDEISIVGS